MRPSVTLACAAATTSLLIALSGCPAADPCADQVLYAGEGTDEVLLTLNDAKARATTDPSGPTITAPTAGATIAKDGDAPTFTWDSPLKLAMLSSPSHPSRTHTADSSTSLAWSENAAAPPKPVHRRGRSLLDVLSGALIPAAHAHEAPVSSDAYLLEIAVDGAACPVTAVTTDLSVQLNADQWAELKTAAGKDLTLNITSAYLQSGRINEGPYKADPVTFQVK